jgi:hypothetical protein
MNVKEKNMVNETLLLDSYGTLLANSNKTINSNELSIHLKKLIKRFYPIPTILFTLGSLLVLLSTMFPYWHMELEAPQYPNGLNVYLYIDNVKGDIFEIDGLNHYIGMRSLDEAAPFERSISRYAMVLLFLISASSVFLRTTRWVILCILPLLAFPFIFLIDLFYWLRLFGQNLDPGAAFSSSVAPFTPPLIGSKQIANFVVINELGLGFYIICFAILFFIVGLYYHQKIYKPLIDASKITFG